MTRFTISDEAAQRLAKKWWPNGEAIRVDDEEKPFTVGFWDQDDPTAFVCMGIGDSWPQAFKAADARRWRGYQVSRLRKAQPRDGGAS